MSVVGGSNRRCSGQQQACLQRTSHGDVQLMQRSKSKEANKWQPQNKCMGKWRVSDSREPLTQSEAGAAEKDSAILNGAEESGLHPHAGNLTSLRTSSCSKSGKKGGSLGWRSVVGWGRPCRSMCAGKSHLAVGNAAADKVPVRVNAPASTNNGPEVRAAAATTVAEIAAAAEVDAEAEDVFDQFSEIGSSVCCSEIRPEVKRVRLGATAAELNEELTQARHELQMETTRRRQAECDDEAYETRRVYRELRQSSKDLCRVLKERDEAARRKHHHHCNKAARQHHDTLGQSGHVPDMSCCREAPTSTVAEGKKSADGSRANSRVFAAPASALDGKSGRQHFGAKTPGCSDEMGSSGGKQNMPNSERESVEALRSSKNYYEVLSVNQNASKADIRKAFHRASKRWHPDRRNAQSCDDPTLADDAFCRIKEAHEVLSDSKRRAAYDIR
eukprot:CAMPEP_0119317130 /NCGR_PEP_ID=MMETSP1333-20130426/42076_1 /TAXON_ID=418940 /ORGANISM="Scyphosphaera apsteinii, Strain RCC1455" /LENGTH=444 /DNA_ID=CAMNT_0007322975 /DNA_START=150 /DNA_END=1480 /DNA_ORIENTATION=+